MNDYIYTPLKTATTIRLLELQPAHSREKDSLWQGESRAVPFEAVSYTWGDEQGIVFVRQEGARKSVAASQTLGEILDTLRPRRGVRRLWIDAICINQRDIGERNAVVPRMRDIYQQATAALICLGRERFWSSLIPLTISVINQSIAAGEYKTGFAQLDKRIRAAIASGPRQSSMHNDPEDRWGNFRAWLYDRQWFQRAWVVQEAAVAKNSVVHCGDWELPGAIFFQTLGLFAKYPMPRELGDVVDGYDWGVEAALQQLSLMRSLGAGSASVQLMPLIDLLKRSRRTRATDPHDHIYSLLGLAVDADLPDVDYAQPWQETYKQFTLRFVRDGHLADVLQNCMLDDDWSPTWVPNWSANYGNSPAFLIPYHSPGVNTAGYRAGGATPTRHSLDGDVLCVSGRLVTTIDRFESGTGFAKPWDSAEMVTAAALERFEAIQTLAALASEDRALADITAWRTLLCGQHWDTNRLLEPADLEVCYAWVGSNCHLLDAGLAVDAQRGAPHSTRKRQMVSRLARDEYKPWNRSVLQPPPPGATRRMELKARAVISSQRLCVTEDGLLGQAPRRALEGDVVALFEGVSVPMVLRANDDAFQIVGAGYFADLMDGRKAGVEEMYMIPLG